MNKLQTLYQLLNISVKIQDQSFRIMYLVDVWGLDQRTIGEIENGLSQSSISRLLNEARHRVTIGELHHVNKIMMYPSEIKYIQSLPRDVFNDMEVMAFVKYILDLHPLHSFYETENRKRLCICALSSLGIRNKKLEQLFNKPQSTISMTIKRYSEQAAKIEVPNRYDFPYEFTFKQEGLNKQKPFYLAGGQDL